MVVPCRGADRSTKRPNRVPKVLPGAGWPEAADVRGPEGLLRRGSALGRSGQGVRLHPGVLPGPVPPVPAGPRSRLLREGLARPALAAQEVGRARPDRGATQAEPLGLRDQRRAQEPPHAPEPHRRARGPQGGGVRAATPTPRRGTTLPTGPHGRARRRRALVFARPAHRDHQLRRACSSSCPTWFAWSWTSWPTPLTCPAPG